MKHEEIKHLHYRPCVGIMLLNKDNHIFSGHRLDNNSTAWQMPQGGIESGETPLRAALRELAEETSVLSSQIQILSETTGWITYDLPINLIPKLWQGRYRGQEQKWFLMRFLGDDSLINISTKTPEFNAWRWLSAIELIDRVVPFKRKAYEQVINIFHEFLICP